MLCVISYAQSISTKPQQTFHVRGKIVDSHNSAIAGAEVKFEGSQTTKATSSDSRGFYRAELPVGTYSMTVTTSSSAHLKRPLFRVSLPKTIALDVTLGAPLRNCDPISIGVTRPDGTAETKTVGTPDGLRDECGGWDRFPIFSGEDGSFELFIRYDSRRRSDVERDYDSGFQNPVFIAFNLFTLTAGHVTYETASRTLLATGNVTVTNGSAGSAHADSMKFRIDNARVLRLP
jgi:hypothetical protein